MIVSDIIAANAARARDKACVVDELRRLSFAELTDRIERLANALTARGVGRGERIAVFTDNCHEHVEVIGAAALSGLTTAAGDARLAMRAPPRLLRASPPSVLVVDHAYRSLVAAHAPVLASAKVRICVDGGAAGWEDYESLLARSSPGAPRPRMHPVELAQTAGRRWWNGAHARTAASAGNEIVREDDRVLIATPLSQVDRDWTPIVLHACGCTIVLRRRNDAGGLLDAIERESITVVVLTAAELAAMLAHSDLAWRDMTHLRAVYCCGPVPATLLRCARAAFGPTLFRLQACPGHWYDGALAPQRFIEGSQPPARA